MLRERVLQVTQRAYEKDALRRVVADHQLVKDMILNIQFIVFKTKICKPKPTAASSTIITPVFRDPFAKENIESDLFVSTIHDTHHLLLNKFNVVDEHAVLATIAYEPQESRLTIADFKAMWTCMIGMDAFAFYNCGYASGASQPHKHMQLIGYGSMQEYTSTKMPPLLQFMVDTLRSSSDFDTNGSIQIAQLPFHHLIRRIVLTKKVNCQDAAGYLVQHYIEMCGELMAQSATLKSRLESTDDATEKDVEDLTAYNLILTTDFILIVPRKTQSYMGIEVNAIGFTGSFLVRSQEQLDFLTKISSDGISGPMKLLSAVTFNAICM